MPTKQLFSGAWGSGRTALLRMASESLREDWGAVILWFNPWLFSGTKHLVGIFFP
jgi:predicted KAP-like P-loop ATPase